MQFGDIIQDARVKAELKQKELAARILKEDGKHISAPYLNDIERNRRTPSSDHMIEQFSKVLKIRPELGADWFEFSLD
ncbi:MAG TPA: helix-turn-helix transcriptional regulator [Pyrinomonadaceae bacterium]|jgi:ribosome-binding protein aMBF1 (putative translation factor)